MPATLHSNMCDEFGVITKDQFNPCLAELLQLAVAACLVSASIHRMRAVRSLHATEYKQALAWRLQFWLCIASGMLTLVRLAQDVVWADDVYLAEWLQCAVTSCAWFIVSSVLVAEHKRGLAVALSLRCAWVAAFVGALLSALSAHHPTETVFVSVTQAIVLCILAVRALSPPSVPQPVDEFSALVVEPLVDGAASWSIPATSPLSAKMQLQSGGPGPQPVWSQTIVPQTRAEQEVQPHLEPTRVDGALGVESVCVCRVTFDVTASGREVCVYHVLLTWRPRVARKARQTEILRTWDEFEELHHQLQKASVRSGVRVLLPPLPTHSLEREPLKRRRTRNAMQAFLCELLEGEAGGCEAVRAMLGLGSAVPIEESNDSGSSVDASDLPSAAPFSDGASSEGGAWCHCGGVNAHASVPRWSRARSEHGKLHVFYLVRLCIHGNCTVLRKRFSAFVAVQSRVAREESRAVLAPLPARRAVAGFFNKHDSQQELRALEKRRKALEVWANQMLDSTLRTAAAVCDFFECELEVPAACSRYSATVANHSEEEGHVLFHIHVHDSEFDVTNVMWRRFSQFVPVRDALSKCPATHALPALPSKLMLSLEKRRKQLELFVQTALAHHAHRPVLREFLNLRAGRSGHDSS